MIETKKLKYEMARISHWSVHDNENIHSWNVAHNAKEIKEGS